MKAQEHLMFRSRLCKWRGSCAKIVEWPQKAESGPLLTISKEIGASKLKTQELDFVNNRKGFGRKSHVPDENTVGR